MRYERHKDRARQRNIERAAPDRRSKLNREQERDISEQIALGMPAKTTTTGEGMFDARLFNQSRGMDSGFNDDESFAAYDQPWRKEGSLANNIYRPGKNLDSEMYGGAEDLEALRFQLFYLNFNYITNDLLLISLLNCDLTFFIHIRSSKRFVPDKEFSGADRGVSGRSGPVQFEKEEADPFGLDAFLDTVKTAERKRPNDDDRRKDDR